MKSGTTFRAIFGTRRLQQVSKQGQKKKEREVRYEKRWPKSRSGEMAQSGNVGLLSVLMAKLYFKLRLFGCIKWGNDQADYVVLGMDSAVVKVEF